MPYAVLADYARYVFLAVPGRTAPFTARVEQVLPCAVFKTLANCFLGQFIDRLALSRGFRLKLGQQFVGDVDAVLGCHSASPPAYRSCAIAQSGWLGLFAQPADSRSCSRRFSGAPCCGSPIASWLAQEFFQPRNYRSTGVKCRVRDLKGKPVRKRPIP